MKNNTLGSLVHEDKALIRSQLGTVFRIAWPAVLESFFLSLAGMIDTLMVSTIGADAVAAVGLTSQPKFLGLAVFMAMNIAVSAMVARRKGEGRRREANETLAVAVVITLVLTVIVTALTVGFAGPIIRFCGSAPDTHSQAVTYYSIIMGGTVFNSVSMVLNAAQRGSGNTRVSMIANITSSIVNVFANYCLIGGNFGFPALGITGAALATVLGTVVAMGISVASLYRKDGFLNLPYIAANRAWRHFGHAAMIARMSVSTLTEQVLMRIGFMATAIMAADMGTKAMAAHQVGMNCLGLSFSFGDGMQAAAVALIGQSLGQNRKDLARKYGWLCEGTGILLALMMCIVYMLGGRALFGLFFAEEEIVNIGVGITRILMITVLFQICQVIFTGCLRGAGDVFYTMITSMVSVTIIRTAVGYVCCYVLGFGIYGIWMGIMADQLVRLVMNGIRFAGGKWTEIRI